jgi:DNA mismatch repair ATPase MutS
LESINPILFNFSNKIAWIDIFISISILSQEKNWVKPKMTNQEKIEIIN